MNTVTKGEVMANMKEVVCRTEEVLGKPVTHVSVRMKNGFTLHETTTCVDPENYDERIGRRICLQRIEEKIWFLLGYALQDRLASESKANLRIRNKTMPNRIWFRFQNRNMRLC